jgi:hypothetical protein
MCLYLAFGYGTWGTVGTVLAAATSKGSRCKASVSWRGALVAVVYWAAVIVGDSSKHRIGMPT